MKNYFLKKVYPEPFCSTLKLSIVYVHAGNDNGRQCWDEEPTTFISKDEKSFQCGKCLEELGELTDENIEHQSDYHSCAEEYTPIQKLKTVEGFYIKGNKLRTTMCPRCNVSVSLPDTAPFYHDCNSYKV